MQNTKVLVIGSGGYSALIESALQALPVMVTVIDSVATDIDFATLPADYIIIATPNFTHADFVARALKAGKHVLCEKPLAINLADVKRLYHLAHAYKRYLGVGFVLTNHPFYSFIKAGQTHYGPIQKISVYNHATEGMLQPEWYWNKEQSGGWFLVSEVHWYHLIAWLTEAKSLKVLTASEEKKNGRTVATFSHVMTGQKQELKIEHRLDRQYEAAWTKVVVDYADASVVVSDWVPRLCAFPADQTQSLVSPYFAQQDATLLDTRSRDEIYKSLVRENLIKMVKHHPTDNSHAIILAHQAALDAQKLADKT